MYIAFFDFHNTITLNIFTPVIFHGLTTLYYWRMIIDYFGEEILFLFASPILRALLSSCITAKNDGYFMVWVCVDSLFPLVVLPWTFQPFSQVLLWLCIGFFCFVFLFILMFSKKNGWSKALEQVLSLVMVVIFYEELFFEMEYAMVMFHDITWGNREICSHQPSSKLNVKCYTEPNEKSWAGSSTRTYHKTFVSRLLPVSPFIHRVSLAVILYFNLVPKDYALGINFCWSVVFYAVVFYETMMAPTIKLERNYKAGSSIRLPGPILESVNLDKCKKEY